MRHRRGARQPWGGNLSRGAVVLGSVGVPASQWAIFALVAHQHGAASAGGLALAVALATPIFTLTGWGTRNAYITLNQRYAFRPYAQLRAVGVVAGTILTIGLGTAAGVPGAFVIAIAVQKVADSVSDLMYGVLQRERTDLAFGLLMLANSVLTVGLAAVAAFTGEPAEVVLAASAVGSGIAALGAVLFAWHRSLTRVEDTLPLSDRQARGEILRRCTPIAASHLLATLIINVPIWAVGILGSPADVAIFAAASYMITVGSVLGSTMNAVAIGSYASRVSTQGIVGVIHSSRRVAWIVTTLALVGALAIWPFGSVVFSILYGADFEIAPVLLFAVGCAAALHPGIHMLNASLMAANRYGRQFAIVLWATLSSIAVIVVLGLLGTDARWVGAAGALAAATVQFLLSALETEKTKRQEDDAQRATVSDQQ